MKKTILFGLALLATTTLQAQEKTESKLVVKPSGRILLDAGLFDASDEINNQLNDGMAIPDMRVGFKATYEDWTAKVDIGYAYGKVGMKDVFIEHSLGKKSLIRAGYFVHQYGLQSATSSSFKISMEEPRSNQALNNARLLGVMFEHSDLRYLVTTSFFSETDAMKMTSDKTGNQGIGVMARALPSAHRAGPYLPRGRFRCLREPALQQRQPTQPQVVCPLHHLAHTYRPGRLDEGHRRPCQSHV